MKKYALLMILVITAMTLAGCGKEFVCNPPYMQMGETCCLDKDSNGVCDKDEVVKQVIDEMPVPDEEELEDDEPQITDDGKEEEEVVDDTEEEPQTTDDNKEEEEVVDDTEEEPQTTPKPSSSDGVRYEQSTKLQTATLKKESSIDCEGEAEVHKRDDGSYYLELVDFKTESAPRLYAYLSSKTSVRKESDLITSDKGSRSRNAYKLEPQINRFDAISIMFDIPGEVDLSEYDLVVVADNLFNKVHCTGKLS